MSFDSLTYARRLKAAGFSEAQAEALADANRELLMSDLATKDDVALLRGDTVSVRTEMAGMEQKLRGDMVSMEQRQQAAIEALGLRLTIRLGMMMGAAVAILGAILRLH
jgi:hypothetical protein